MGNVADRLVRLLVLMHEPTENYAVDDVLLELTDTPAPGKLPAVAMWNRRNKGWTSDEQLNENSKVIEA